MDNNDGLPEGRFEYVDEAEFGNKAVSNAVGVLATENEDVRAWRELITYGLKGLGKLYSKHANALDNEATIPSSSH